MAVIFDKPRSLTDVPFSFCGGCAHGIVHTLVAQTMDELEITDKTIGIASVGCSVMAYNFFACDMQQAAHGRAPAVATGVKRVHPDRMVFTYQGDGDLAAIGTAETIHAAARSENITIIFINNAIYGMTGGQMAPTSLLGQVTQTTPKKRTVESQGYPLRVSELLSTIEGSTYIERCAANNVKNIRATKKAIKKAFEIQKQGGGFSLVEVLSNCPTNWVMSPKASMDWIESDMMPCYPLGVYCDKSAERGVKFDA
ncbi:MAG: thiamine pyrophosphate-dependent enzyme [Oscillospiraceae bacterium]|nr:thiamine pyrophosphate-dependent enzyme [Oscillospiraceae bacterium]